MACKCLSEMDAELRKHNTRIQTQFSFAGGNLADVICTPYIGTEKIDTKQRKKALGIVATFCPFCGLKYREKRNAA